MKQLLTKLTSSSLSTKARSSNLSDFVSRVGLSFVGMPLGGYLLGILADQLWPGDISWAMALALLGFTLGCVYLWQWIRQP